MTEALFQEFEPATRQQWLDAVLKSLGSEPIDSLITETYEGIAVHPLPQADDLAGIPHLGAPPGQYPFVRGTRAAGYHARPWLIAADIDLDDAGDFNAALREALAQGQTAIALTDAQAAWSAGDIRSAFAQIDLGRFPIFVQSERAPEIYDGLRTTLDSEAVAGLRGCVGWDAAAELARRGETPGHAYGQLARHKRTLAARSPLLGSIAIDAAVYHEAGANAVQELAFALASAVECLRQLEERGIDLDSAARSMNLFFRVGENFFTEIAKFRAIKPLWAQMTRAFGLGRECQRARLHASSGRRNKSRLDPYGNLLRATSEALAAVLGGVDSLNIAPFDQPSGKSGEFSRRLARNLQLILAHELQLTRLIDPAGGSWRAEKLTDQLARAAWARFQAIEAGGGLLKCLGAGEIQAEIAAVAQRRKSDLAAGDAVLVGVNRFVNAEAAPPDASAEPQPEGSHGNSLVPLRLADPFEAPHPAGDGEA